MKLYFISWGLLLTAMCISSKELSDVFALPKNLKLQMVNAVSKIKITLSKVPFYLIKWLISEYFVTHIKFYCLVD